jgi:hypothetical protein
MATIHDDELRDAAKALGVLRLLSPSSPRTDQAVHWLRLAAGTATDAITMFSSDEARDEARGTAATNLRGVAGPLDRGEPLTRDMIDKARHATADWISALNEP